MEINENEYKVLDAIVKSNYQWNRNNVVNQQIWSSDIAEGVNGLAGNQVSGTISGLTKKGFVGVNKTKKRSEQTLWITQSGHEVYNNYKAAKQL